MARRTAAVVWLIDDDDVAGSEGGHEDLLDIGEEALCVDRVFDDARGVNAIAAQDGPRPPLALAAASFFAE